MRVLIVTNMFPTEKRPVFGIFVKEQVDSIRRYHPDVEYDVYSIDGGGVQGASKWISLKNYINSIIAVDRIVRKGAYDLIHVHYGFSGLFLLNPFRKRIPTLVTLHGGDIQPEQKKQFQVFATRRLLKNANFAITLNERMDKIAHHYIKNTKIVPCAANTDFFTPVVKDATNTKPLVIFPSDKTRFVKNYPLFLETINVLKEKYEIECMTSEVHKMSRSQVRDLYYKADLMLMTSISEGSPQVVKEAMACNLPVVSTPVGDVEILLQNVRDSGVSKKHDAEELADLCFKSLTGKIGGVYGSERLVSLGLDNKSISDEIYNIYNQLL